MNRNIPRDSLTRWPKDSKEFTVKIHAKTNRNGSRSYACYLPHPIIQMLGEPESIKISVKDDDNTITMEVG